MNEVLRVPDVEIVIGGAPRKLLRFDKTAYDKITAFFMSLNTDGKIFEKDAVHDEDFVKKLMAEIIAPAIGMTTDEIKCKASEFELAMAVIAILKLYRIGLKQEWINISDQGKTQR